MKQLSFFKKEKSDFGGSLYRKGKRKVARPLSFFKPMHLVIKSSKAKGKFAFAPTDQKTKAIILKFANRFHLRLYTFALNWSHIHLVLRIPDRKSYQRFIRALTASLAAAKKAEKGFFDLLPFSKIGSWGRQFKNWQGYLVKNEMQAAGLTFSHNKTKLKRHGKFKMPTHQPAVERPAQKKERSKYPTFLFD